MSYYSDYAVEMPQVAYDEMLEAVNKESAEDKDSILNFIARGLAFGTVKPDGTHIMLWKNSDFHDNRNKLWNWVRYQVMLSKHDNVAIVRIGEDTEDVEIDGDTKYLEIVREIRWQ